MSKRITCLLCLLVSWMVSAGGTVDFLPVESQLTIDTSQDDTLYHVKDGSFLLNNVRSTNWGIAATSRKPSVIRYRIPAGVLEPGTYRVIMRLDIVRHNQLHLKVFTNQVEVADHLFPPAYGLQKIFTSTRDFQYGGGALELAMQSMPVEKGDRLRLRKLSIVPQFKRNMFSAAGNYVLRRGEKEWKFSSDGALIGIRDNRQPERRVLGGDRSVRPPFQLEYRSDMKSSALPLTVTKVEENRNRLVFHYDLGGKIEVKTVADIRADGDLDWRIKVDNRSSLEIIGIRFPIVSNLEIGDAKDDVLYYPKSLGMRVANPKANLVSKGEIYGHTLSMNYMLLADGQRGGFYLGGHDPKLIDNALEYSMAYGSPLLSMKNLATVKTGETYSSAPFRLATYVGNWHQGAKIYRAYAQTWMKPVPYPSWGRVPAAPLMKNRWISITDAGGTRASHKTKVLTRFSELVGHFESFIRDYSTPVIWVQGQMIRGNCYRYYHLNPDAGSEQEYRNAVREIRAKGGVVCNYTNGMNWDLYFPENMPPYYRGRVDTEVPGIPDWKKFTHDNKIVGVRGEEKLQYPGKGSWNFRIMCPNAAGWRHYMNHWIVDRYARDYGVNAMQIDQVGCTDFGTCFANDKHGHANHGAILTGYRKMLGEILANAQKVIPDFWTFPEGVCDAYNDVSCFMGWNGYYGEEEGYFYPEMIRYTLPNVALRGNPMARNRELYLGIAASFDTPAGNELYKRIADWYARAEYCHNEGVESGNPELEVSVLRNREDRAVIMVVHALKPFRGKLGVKISADEYPELVNYRQRYSYQAKALIRKAGNPRRFSVQEKSFAAISQDGWFSVDDELDLSADEYQVFVFSADKAERIRIHVPAQARLNKPFTIKVTDQKGIPLSGVRVQMGDRHQNSDANGQTVWCVKEFSGDYYVRADKQGMIFNNSFIHVAN